MSDLEFRVLGPLEVWRGADRLGIDAPRQRGVLAALLLNANRVVPVDRLIELLWEGRPPACARNTVQSLVLRLRRALGPPGAGVLVTRRPGYLLRVGLEQIDVHRFERLLERGRAALAGDRPDEAAGLLRGALALWRGPPLLDAAADGLREREVPRLADLRLAALEERLACDLVLGRHRELVGELRGLVARHPLRERLHGQLMLALYRSGRQAEALAAYATLRRTLVGELGIEPGPDIQRLHRDMLRRHASLDLAGGDPPSGTRPVPCQLPPDVADFTGRERVLAELGALLATGGAGVAVAGQAGVGKTALAIRLAHEAAGRYPHGRLFVDLRGMDACPLDPVRVLGQFLRALGVSADAVPEDAGERAALYRTLLAERRVLVVLDNAADEAQVRPLLPGAAGCGVLVTSRRALATLEGLAVRRLGLLAPDEAVALLRRIVGPARTAVRDDADRVAALCGRLPLAVRIAGARLVTRPHWSLGHLADRLATVRRRLDELVAGDLEVRASLALSVPGLAPEQWRALCRLGALWCDDFAPWLAAAVLDVPLDRAADLVEMLVDAQLVEAGGADPARQLRYGFHDLVRLFVRERPESAAERDAVLRRALDACVEFAQHAAARVERVAPHGTPTWPGPPDGGPGRCAQAEAALAGCDPLTWFDAERRLLVSAVDEAVVAGLTGHAWRIARALAPHFEVRGHWEDWRHTHERALSGADVAGEAALLAGLGQLAVDQGRGPVAADRLNRAADLARQVGDPLLRAVALRALGDAYVLDGRPCDAIDRYTTSLALAREQGYRTGEAQSLRGLGLAYRDAGRIAEALATLEESLTIVRGMGDDRLEPWALGTLGTFRVEARQWDAAATCLREAAAVAARLGDVRARVYALRGLADALRGTGRPAEAVEILDEVLAVVRELGEDLGEAQTLRRLGESYADLGRRDDAVRCLRAARVVAESVGFERLDAEAAYPLGVLLLDGGELADAIGCLEFCAGVFDRHGMRLARARACLALGRALRRLGRADRAAELSDEADRIFRQAGLPVTYAQ